MVLAVDGSPVSDVLDFRFRTSVPEFSLLVERNGQPLMFELSLDTAEPLGIEFEAPLFDGLRRCRNHCCFCFLEQLPPGLRPSLYVRDDDYRYSFLHGNFITLTNLSSSDWERLASQRLSPLYVSVHATEQAVREWLLGVHEEPPLMDKLRYLRDHRIEFHAQLVIVPGVNDGLHLEQTLADLLSLGPSLLSVSVVPVGLTRYAPPSLRPNAPEEAQRLILQIRRWRRTYARELGRRTVYAADELFPMSGQAVPPRRYYEGFPQVENGVGLVRLFLDRWNRAKRRGHTAVRPYAGAGPADPVAVPGDGRLVVCGTLIAPVWRAVAAEMRSLGYPVHILPVVNRVLGPTVTVSGLLFGEDVIRAVQESPSDGEICLPRSMFDAEGNRTLDECTLDDIQHRLGRPVCVCGEAAEVIEGLPARSPE